MQSLMFVGSRPEHVTAETWATVGKELGFAAAPHFRILVGSDSESSLDHHVIQGASQAAMIGHSVTWAIHEREAKRGRFPLERWGYLGAPERTSYPDSLDGEGRWQFAHLAALAEADAVIAMGGASNTRRVCRAAEERGVRLWPIAYFGGEAANSAERIAEHNPKSWSIVRKSVSGEWSIRNARKKAHDLVSRILRNPSGKRQRAYFISYAREDQSAADHIEVFLRRRERGVLRDETEFRPGAALPEETRAAIAAADDMLVLSGLAAGQSACVKEEIEIARRLKVARGGKPPDRLVGLMVDGEGPGVVLNIDSLHLDARNRLERELAIDRIISTETVD